MPSPSEVEVLTVVEINLFGTLFWVLLLLAIVGVTIFGEDEGYGL